MLTMHLSGPPPVNPIDLSLIGTALFTQQFCLLPLAHTFLEKAILQKVLIPIQRYKHVFANLLL